MFVAAQGGRSALRAVDLDVLTAIWVVGHLLLLGSFNVSEFQGFKNKTLKLCNPETWSHPPPPRSTGIMELAGFCDLIYRLQ
jgi:hypothetical protein